MSEHWGPPVAVTQILVSENAVEGLHGYIVIPNSAPPVGTVVDLSACLTGMSGTAKVTKVLSPHMFRFDTKLTVHG